MRIIDASSTNILTLGYAGEKNRTEVRFYYGDLLEEFPNGVVLLQVKRPEDEVHHYNVQLEVTEPGYAVWRVSEYDCRVQGFGEAQLIYSTSDTVAKRKKWRTCIDESIEGIDISIPDDWEDVETRLLNAAAAVQGAISAAQEVIADDLADSYEYKRDAEIAAQSAAQSVSSIEAIASNASQSASNAASSAQTANTKALDASGYADNAASSASAASGSAATALSHANAAYEERRRAEQASSAASSYAQSAYEDAQDAAYAAQQAQDIMDDYEAMTAEATTLDPGEQATAEIDRSGDHPVLELGIPQGVQGERGSPGFFVGTEEPEDEDIQVWVDPNGGSNVYYGSTTPTDPWVDTWIDTSGSTAVSPSPTYTAYATQTTNTNQWNVNLSGVDYIEGMTVKVKFIRSGFSGGSQPTLSINALPYEYGGATMIFGPPVEHANGSSFTDAVPLGGFLILTLFGDSWMVEDSYVTPANGVSF